MYVEIAKDLVSQFMERIEEGKVYELNRFLVHPKKINFRPVEGRFMIKFGRYTSVQERNVKGQVEYPFCTFALTPIANLPRPTGLPDRFTDVAGIITGVSKAVQFHSANRSDPSTKRIIYLSDLSGNQVSIVLWGDRATTFDGDWVISTAEKSPVIAIFVGTLVKGYDGRRSLSGSAPYRWYINEDLPEIMRSTAGCRRRYLWLKIFFFRTRVLMRSMPSSTLRERQLLSYWILTFMIMRI